MKITKLSKIYYNKKNTVKALNDINLSFEEKGINIILGSSGSGKTSLLNIITNNIMEYDGKVENIPTFSYLSQDIDLFESLNVIDNLYLVSKDKNKINELLTYFDLEDYINYKVKHLSNGQKRRIQLLCAYLNKAEAIFLDEPTMALDEENAILVMEMIKKISEDCLVILVTHDINLANRYADRIIQIEGGKIIEDRYIRHHNKINTNEYYKNKSFLEHLVFVLKYYLSQPFKLFGLLILSLIMILIINITLSIYTETNKSLDVLDSFAKGDNILVTYNEETIDVDYNDMNSFFYHGVLKGSYDKAYVNYNHISYQSLKDVMNKVDGIKAIQLIFNDVKYYEDSDFTFRYLNYGNSFESFNHQRTHDGTIMLSLGLEPMNRPFFHNKETFKIEDLLSGEHIVSEQESLYLRTYLSHAVKYQDVDLFYLYDDISLKYGKLPKLDNEVIIDENMAKLIMDQCDINNIKDLVGLDFKLGQYFLENEWMISFKPIELQTIIPNENLNNIEVIPQFTYRISGITDLKNNDLRMVFIKHHILEDPFYKQFIKDRTDVVFKEVNFIVDTNKDINEINEEINQILNLEKTKIVPKSKITVDNVYLGRSNESIVVNMMISFVVVMGLYIIINLLDKKEMLKRNKILKSYRYNCKLIDFIKNLLIALLNLNIMMIISLPLFDIFKEIAVKWGYQLYLEYNFSYLFMVTLVIMVISFVIDLVLGKLK